jgi:hypothetical protein
MACWSSFVCRHRYTASRMPVKICVFSPPGLCLDRLRPAERLRTFVTAQQRVEALGRSISNVMILHRLVLFLVGFIVGPTIDVRTRWNDRYNYAAE